MDDADLDPLLDPSSRRLFLDPDAIGRVEGRLRGVGRPPRSADEMAERLREVGDLTPGELAGPMLGFAEALLAEGREPPSSSCPKSPSPAPAGSPPPKKPIFTRPPSPTQHSGATQPARRLRTIVGRYLRTRALVDLNDLTARYPIDAATASDLLEALADEGGVVPLGPGEDGREQWADARNLGEVRRLSIAIKRREAVAISPEQFAAFVARRQHVHPESRLQGEAAVGLVLDQLQGYPATVDLWEKEILLPKRVDGLPRLGGSTPRLASGAWRWRASGEGRSEPPIAIVPRDFAGALAQRYKRGASRARPVRDPRPSAIAGRGVRR